MLLSLSALAAEPPRGKKFWLDLKDAKFTLPAGTKRADVLKDAIALLDNEDPVLRDEVGYGLALQWVYKEQALSAEEQLAFTRALVTRLGEIKKPVLGRSFAALSLSMVAGAEVKQPKLDADTWRDIVRAACVELEVESDLRGYDAKLGWIHATAHTADLLKFLARDSRLVPAQQAAIVYAIGKRLERGDVFAWGEDERLAAVVRSLALRKDVDVKAFEPWVIGLGVRWKKLWENPKLDAAEFARLNSTKQVLRAVLVTLPPENPVMKRLETVLGEMM
ncbi:MAG: DUF2785 domain-containing protein [Archangium sp.]